MEFTAFLMALVCLFGVFKCSDRASLESQIERQKEFKLYDAEFLCMRTLKQKEIDKLNNEIFKIKAK